MPYAKPLLVLVESQAVQAAAWASWLQADGFRHPEPEQEIGVPEALPLRKTQAILKSE
jgi:hypothetical protein